MSNDILDISVIIRTKNNADTIGTCLKYLSEQSVKVREIIVVDSGSTDSTLKIVEKHKCKIVLYPKKEVFNYSKAINIGIEEASGEYIQMLSAHFLLLDNHALLNLYNFLNISDLIGAASLFPPYGKGNKIDDFGDLDWDVITLSNFTGHAMSNACGLFKRKYWSDYHFNESIPAVEDQEWARYYMKKENLGFIRIKNYPVEYANSYFNAYRPIRDAIAIARHVYPPSFTIKKGLKLMFYNSIVSLIKMDFNKSISNVRMGYAMIRELLGKKNQLLSSYNKKQN